ncbi:MULTISPECIES: hypothetical protein [Sporosarcina]|uniref:hypothetical protein n=1 Tax=Sporosarcina TaxID=1569 RepID=UPI00129B565C|nr:MULTISPECIES: hypothetical protein [Sporosarcina]GKV65278.1 hypothetical protein NCCP2331_14310 [Sporosarcina sp. NCCP-2331]GLB55402.1 hypothetical protein NCCP2378_11890 [Sporosarcina sp. NCCP-2378]
MSTEELVHLPDSAFIHLCRQKYKVTNRVHRMMDLFFCNYGMEGRTERRRHLISFLEYNRIKYSNDHECVESDLEILTEELEEYLEDSFVVMYMRERAFSI